MGQGSENSPLEKGSEGGGGDVASSLLFSV